MTGFGNIYVDSYAVTGTKFSTNNLYIAEDAGIFVYDGHTITAKNVIGSQGSYISLSPITDHWKIFKPLELGTVNVDSNYKIKLITPDYYGPLEDGTQILNSAKADLNKFDISGIVPIDGHEYTLWRKKPNDKKVYLKSK